MMSVPPKLISNTINEGRTSNFFGRKQIRHQYPCNTKRSNGGENGRNSPFFKNFPEIFLLLLLLLLAPFAKSYNITFLYSLIMPLNKKGF